MAVAITPARRHVFSPAHPRKTSGVDIRAGVSVDQVAARKLGLETRFRSMEIGIDRGGNAGSCDTGYSCAYSSNVSWRSDSMPSSKEVNPRLVFERMFASGNSAVAGESYEKRRRYKQSVLDFVADDAARLRDAPWRHRSAEARRVPDRRARSRNAATAR